MQAPQLAGLRSSVLSVLAIALPILVITGYLVVTGLFTKLESSAGDIVALSVAVAVGIPPAWRIANRGPSSIIVTFGYVLLAGVVLFFYSLWFVCGAFNDCL